MKPITYYTFAVGDEGRILLLKNKIKEIEYLYKGPPYGVGGGRYIPGRICEQYSGNVFPRVFKKPSQSEKRRAVDINITIDMLHYASLGNIDAMYLLSGDGDSVPLIQAVMRKGARFYLMVLSGGLNPQLPISVDKFEGIDDRLFQAAQ